MKEKGIQIQVGFQSYIVEFPMFGMSRWLFIAKIWVV
jgi:hypothetical protein